MNKKIAILLALSILILSGCRNAVPSGEFRPSGPTRYTDSLNENFATVFTDPASDSRDTESVLQTEALDQTKPCPTESKQNENESRKDSDDQSQTSKTESPATKPAEPQSAESQPKETVPPATTPKETDLPANELPSTVATTEQEQTEQDYLEQAATETETPATEPEQTEPPDEELREPLDCNTAMEHGNLYGSSTYGWTVDLSLNESNSGFHFGSWVFADQGQAQLNHAAYTQVDFLYQEMQTRYPGLDLSGIRFRVHAFECGDGLYEVRVYYA